PRSAVVAENELVDVRNPGGGVGAREHRVAGTARARALGQPMAGSQLGESGLACVDQPVEHVRRRDRGGVWVGEAACARAPANQNLDATEAAGVVWHIVWETVVDRDHHSGSGTRLRQIEPKREAVIVVA